MGAASSILASYADVMRGGGNIFCTQKIFTNNSNFRATLSTSAPALSTSPAKQEAPNQTTESKKNEGDDNDENEGEENENMENEDKDNKLA
jgi:hypothetical protein